MIELVLTICMIGSENCLEVKMPAPSMQQCQMQWQMIAAQYVNDHPKYEVSSGQCRIVLSGKTESL